jgi:hypothetical protein
MDFSERTPQDFLGGAELLDTDLSDILNSRLLGIEERSKLENVNTQQFAAQEAFRSGLGLEGAGRLSRELGFGQAGQQRAEIARERADVFSAEQEAQQFNANLLSGAATQAEQMNFALDQLFSNLQQQAHNQFLGEVGLFREGEMDEVQGFLEQLKGAYARSGHELDTAGILNAIAATEGDTLQPLMIPDVIDPVQAVSALSGLG